MTYHLAVIVVLSTEKAEGLAVNFVRLLCRKSSTMKTSVDVPPTAPTTMFADGATKYKYPVTVAAAPFAVSVVLSTAITKLPTAVSC